MKSLSIGILSASQGNLCFLKRRDRCFVRSPVRFELSRRSVPSGEHFRGDEDATESQQHGEPGEYFSKRMHC